MHENMNNTSTTSCITTNPHINAHPLSTEALQPMDISCTNPLSIPAEQSPQQSSNLIALHKLQGTPKTPINTSKAKNQLEG